MEKKIFKRLLDDLVFKETMSHEDNREQLVYFLKSLTCLHEDVIKKNLVVSYESVMKKTQLEEKSMRGDVVVSFDGYKINIEAYKNFDYNSLLKSTSYIMKVFSTGLAIGEKYSNIDNVIQINIIENDTTGIFNKFVTEYKIADIKDKSNLLLPDKFTIKYYNLDRINDASYTEINEEIRWLKFIAARNRMARNKIAKGDELLMELGNWIDEYVNNEQSKKMYGEWAEKIALEKGRNLGLAEGRSLGLVEGVCQVAKALCAKGEPKEYISEVTGLSIKELASIIG